MRLQIKLIGVTLAFVIGMAASASADDNAVQLRRNATDLSKAKTVVVAPPVVELRFDRGNDIPDPNQVTYRFEVANRLSEIVEAKLKSGNLKLIPHELASLAMREKSWAPVDLYITRNQGTIASPAETIHNRAKDQAVLLASRAEMVKTPDDMTIFSFSWHDLPDKQEGLACFRAGSIAMPDTAKLKELGEKVHADAILLCQVTDLESHDGVVVRFPLAFSKFFSATSFRVHFMLVRPLDGEVLWEAEAKGRKEVEDYRGATNGDEGRMAIAGAVRAVDQLVADLYGTGAPADILAGVKPTVQK